MPDLVDWLVENEPTFRKSRLPSLYSDLSVQKTTNPEGYAANVTVWQTALARAAAAGQLPSQSTLILQSSDELLNALASSQYGRPSGLGLVLDESVRSGKMIRAEDFHAAEASIYQRSWVSSPLTILRWGLHKAGLGGQGSYDLSGRLRSGQLVLVSGLEEVSKKLIAAQRLAGTNSTDRVMTRPSFQQLAADTCQVSLSMDDVKILLRFLSRDLGEIIYDSSTVKFKAPTSATPEPITMQDTTIASLRDLIKGLESQTQALEKLVDSQQHKAQEAVRKKNKQVALAALKSKKMAEATLQQRSNTLHQLEEVYAKIEQAVDQVEIVEAMQASATVLKSLNKRVGSVERVEDMVADIREQMTQVEEVGQVLQEPLAGHAIIDEAELDDELEALEKEETKVREAKEADVTRRKLENLGRMEAQIKAEQKQATEDALRDSIEQLNTISLEDKTTEGGRSQAMAESSS